MGRRFLDRAARLPLPAIGSAALRSTTVPGPDEPLGADSHLIPGTNQQTTSGPGKELWVDRRRWFPDELGIIYFPVEARPDRPRWLAEARKRSQPTKAGENDWDLWTKKGVGGLRGRHIGDELPMNGSESHIRI
jgi:hypothetical protein